MPSDFQPSTAISLPSTIRSQMEQVFRTSFSDVTYQIGPEPAAIGVPAFASGTRLFFAPGVFDPLSRAGFALIAHELAHVVQQRSKKLRDSYPRPTGLLLDHSSEQEADAMADEALKAWIPSAVSQHHTSANAFQLSQPLEICEGSYQIAAGIGHRLAGSVLVHQGMRSTIKITDLKVAPEFRTRGLGRVLIHSALQTGLHLAKRYAVLVCGDSGTGRLAPWYEALGFHPSGFHKGYPEYAARIARALSGVICFTAPPLSSQWIQCKEDDAAKRQARAARFAPDFAMMAQGQAQAAGEKQRLRQLVTNAFSFLKQGGPISAEADASFNHKDGNPSQTFGVALHNAMVRGEWEKIEGQTDPRGVIITIRLGGGNTVAAVHNVEERYFLVIHSGPTAGGVGYGTCLGD
jgi:ribosomal protein S18 acetylase RimI-like enzyme